MSDACEEPAFLSLLDEAALTVLARYRDALSVPVHSSSITDARALRRVTRVTQARVPPTQAEREALRSLVSPGCSAATVTAPPTPAAARSNEPAAGGFSGEGA